MYLLKKTDMIPSGFRDYFVSSSTAVQQEIVSSLLSISLQESEIKDSKEIRSVSCPYCSPKPYVIMVGSTVFSVIFVTAVKRTLARPRASFGLPSRRRTSPTGTSTACYRAKV